MKVLILWIWANLYGWTLAGMVFITALIAFWKQIKIPLIMVRKFLNKPAMDMATEVILILKKQDVKHDELMGAIQTLQEGQKFTQVAQRMNMDASGLMYVVCDENGNAIEVSPALVKYMGVPESQQKGTGYLNMIPVEHHERIGREAAEAIKFKRDYYISYPVKNAKGEEVLVSTYARYGGRDWFLIITPLEILSKPRMAKTG